MLIRYRGFLTGFALLCLSAISLAAAVQTARYGLPETPPANSTVLIRMLGSDDLRDETPSARQRLAKRVERELRDGVDWQSELAALDEGQRSLVVGNLAELARESFMAKVEVYFSLPEVRRRRFLDRQIDEILSWSTIVERASQPDGKPLLGPAAVAGLMSRIGQWHQEADPEELARLEKFQQALRTQMVDRIKRRLRPNQD